MINEWVYLRWERGTRYYEAHLHQDPLGGLGVDPRVGAARDGIGTDGTYPLRFP
jgi:hypothetical protein